MAMKLVERRKKIIECSICIEMFEDPRSLPCIHTFCLKCLKMLTRSRKPGNQLPCPLCQTNFTIPQSGVDGLPKNFVINELIELEASDVQSETSVRQQTGAAVNSSQPSMSNVTGLLNAVRVQQQLVQQQQQQQQRMIWQGTLEWLAKPASANGGNVGPRLSCSLPCRISVGPEVVGVNASKWPSKLQMNLIPNTLLKPLAMLFRHSQTVVLNFQQIEPELGSLFQMLVAGFGGCISIPATGAATASDVRVLFMMYSHRKHAYIGLVPNDQTRFVQGLRTSIMQHKRAHELKPPVVLQQQQQQL